MAAVALGAAVAAVQTGFQERHDTAEAGVRAMAGAELVGAAPISAHDGTDAHFPEILTAAPFDDPEEIQRLLANGQHAAADIEARATAGLRPLFVKFTQGTFTSGYGSRWGVTHFGVDLAAPIGTPIEAVEDGTVLSAGPADGFGMWVRLLHDDGTITVYGHVDTTTVTVGQRVLAGDEIATVGNRGFSTGPHCHFEVWLNGNQKVDPLPWLASRGISLGPEQD
ncbi:M23 family metallopeptidase [Nocardia huaxiensis]|uniref:M23 family metallopeptidase n=1 Tax=Nocardia huaxiensis TaxID=2755382 RepID=UPI001E2DB42C|nr:M23 family metallopeptidase [Nocardia huaxiensis]UFS97304.1 M23 family metallopeptidase [Nocardia huaxiensis]